jgi:uncharacterized membrane protein
MDRRWARRTWHRVEEAIGDNQWIFPAVGGVLGLILAQVIGTGSGNEASEWAISVDRARDWLIASLGLTFTALSIVLALASVAAQNIVGRFGSRTLRIYIRHSVQRWIVGAFAFTASFILSEQFQLRTLGSEAPTPTAPLVVSALLIVAMGSLLIWYISAVIRWFRVDQAVASIIASERSALRAASRSRRGTSMATVVPERPDGATDVVAPRSGYLAEFDLDSMLQAATKVDAMVTITRPLRAAVVENETIGWMSSRTVSQAQRQVAEGVDISRTREMGQSIEYGLFALVDIAIIALSPAVNDPNSAVEVIEEMSFLFAEIAKVPLGPYVFPDADSWPCVVVKARTLSELVELATTQIVLYGITDPEVAQALRRFAASLNLLDLGDADQRYVDALAAKLDGPSPA